MSVDTDAYEISARHNGERADKYPPGWTEGDVERLVGRISERVMNHFYEEVGRSVLRRILQFLGWAVVAGLSALAAIKVKEWI